MNTESNSEHLNDDILAAFLDGRLAEDEHRHVAVHLDNCESCRQEVGLAASVLVELEAPRRRARWLVPAAAAAAVVATLLLIPPDRPPVQRGDRSEGPPTFEVVSPTEGQILASAPSLFTWRAPDPDASYELTLTDERGDVVWSARTGDTMLVLPDSVVLGSGQYYWVVDALLERAREATTGVHQFRVGN